MEAASSLTMIDAKIVILGEQNVGKTSFVVVFNPKGMKDKTRISSTVGASFVTCQMTVADRSVKMQIWDTAGQERFRSMAPLYYRKANAAVIMYDICDLKTFTAAKLWVNELKRNVEAPVLILLVGNKTDLSEQRVISNQMGQEYATSVGAIFCETSATSNQGVSEAFYLLARNLIEYEEKHSNFEYKLNSDSIRMDPSEKEDDEARSPCC